ncbi:hypothetical protein G0U57_018982, partial [Chelydra serpentina]
GAVNYLIAFPTSTLKPKVYHVNSLKPFFPQKLKVCQFTAQGEEDAKWPKGVYYKKKNDGALNVCSASKSRSCALNSSNVLSHPRTNRTGIP